jgi:glycosyltransferase involved in cell wall biosynthesis
MKLLIFVVAYNAAKHIAKVLDDIPDEYKNNPDVEILIIDDASKDETVHMAEAHAKAADLRNVRVLKNPRNQGYGGNQKVGYRYAVQNSFDVAVMLHGDGQYTPRALPELIQPFKDNPNVGCVLGVRFGMTYSPLKGGMPFYKYLGNRILTTLQNKLAHANLNEWHTGYRAYSTAALSRIAFTLNTQDFHFDTEILLQLLHSQVEIVQVNIPTRYGDEICHVNGMRYAKDVMKATLKFFLQKYHLFYDVRFHPEVLTKSRLSDQGEESVYEEKLGATSPHSLVCCGDEIVPRQSTVLDIGCAGGYVASFLANNKGCRVTGIDMLPPEKVNHASFEYLQINLESNLDRLDELLDRNKYDVVVMLDVLEHLAGPELFLLNLSQRRYASPPRFVCSTANVAFVVVRLMLLFGHFNYGRKGILDVTHKRLFSLHTFRNLLIQTGFVITKEHFLPFPFAALGFSPEWAGRLERINQFLIRLRPGLFAYQILFETVPLNTPDSVLRQTLEWEKERKASLSMAGGGGAA